MNEGNEMVSKTKELLQKYGIKMTKSLGQNFLINIDICKKIVDGADVRKKDIVVEVGPGIGSMTVELAQRTKAVAAIEIDKKLIPALKENTSCFNNVFIFNEDILQCDIKEVIKKVKQSILHDENADEEYNLKVVSNLPYYITTPVIMKFIENRDLRFSTMVYMVQKEVAQRIVAKPGNKDYGILSVAVQYYAKAVKLFDVSPGCFIPKPEVDSSVIRLDAYPQEKFRVDDAEMFFKVVKASFSQRRKTLLNALSNNSLINNIDRDTVKEILAIACIEESARAEQLSIDKFCELANVILKYQCTKNS